MRRFVDFRPEGVAKLLLVGNNVPMPQSLSSVYVHIVFSTRGRKPLLSDRSLRLRLFAGLATISNNLECQTVIVGGMPDHVHLLARQSSKVCLADWIRSLKSNSTPWVKRQSPQLAEFAWQAGYGAFSVTACGLGGVKAYIEDREHNERVAT